jgi:AcrR family transcriptional regulator
MRKDNGSPPPYTDLIFPTWEGTNTKGRETRQNILRTALSIVIDEGYRAMSMRRVAAKSGIEFGNLTYHYPTREDLVTELLESVFRAYDVTNDAIGRHSGLSAEDRLVEMIEFALSEIRNKRTSHLLPELWALSNHDPFVYRNMHAIYRRSLAPVFDIVKGMRPDLPDEHCTALVLFLNSSIEGLMVVAGYRKPYTPWVPGFARIAARTFVDLFRRITVEEVGALESLPAPNRLLGGPTGRGAAARSVSRSPSRVRRVAARTGRKPRSR